MTTIRTTTGMIAPRGDAGWWLKHGVIGGLIGAILMGMVSMILFPLLGIGSFWQPMNLIAAVFNQAWGSFPGFGLTPSIVGMVVHMMMSAVLGLIFVAIASRLSANLILEAVIYSLVVWVVADFLVLPTLDPTMARTFPAWLFALVHVMYGLGLGGYLNWQAQHTGMLGAAAPVERPNQHRAA